MITEVKKEIQDSWSEDGLIYYYSGRAFGLTVNCATICLGDAEVIKKALPTKQLPTDLHPLQGEALNYVLECREEQKDGEFEPKKRSPIRGRHTRDFKRREKSIRQFAVRQAISGRLFKQPK